METPPPDTRTALLQAALVCFADHGFDGTSMRMIAERAGRPLSLLSHHFGNKEGLYLEVFKSLLEPEDAVAMAPEVVRAGVRDRQGAIRVLREQIHILFGKAAPESGAGNPFRDYEARLWAQEFRAPRPSLHPLLREYIGPTVEVLRHCIAILRPDLSEAQVAFAGMTLIGQVTGHGAMAGLNRVLWGDYPPFGSRFQEAELLVDLCLAGLQAEGSAR
jgi:AcrR family transcriptional regulator